jgi:soluble lytic murein transglycosylase-like protein
MKKVLVFLSLIVCSSLFPLVLEAKAENPLKKMYDSIITATSWRHDVPSELVHSIIREESNYDSFAISPKGAMGLMQLMPETARNYGVKNVFDPGQNIEGGIKYLKDLIQLFDRKTSMVLAAYNAGQEAIKKFGGIPPYPETKNYIKRIMASYTKTTIMTRTIIYKFYDESGHPVFTNNPNLYLLHKEK